MEQRPKDCPDISSFKPSSVCYGCKDISNPLLGLGEEFDNAHQVSDENDKDHYADWQEVCDESLLQLHVPPSPLRGGLSGRRRRESFPYLERALGFPSKAIMLFAQAADDGASS